MRKILFVFLILAVVAVVGFLAYLELRVPEIVYVDDTTHSWADGREMVLRRLYNSGVDIDAYFEKVEDMLITADFTDDEIFAAALASGTPEFFPAFYFSMHNPDIAENEFVFTAMTRQEQAPGQDDFNFNISNLYLEVTTNGPMISDVELRPENAGNSDTDRVTITPVLSADGRSLAVELDNISSYNFLISGAGSMTFQYTYDIIYSNLLSSTALEEQLLIVHVNFARSPNGEFIVEYINEPYSDLEEYLY
ncbi:MAG: hypothetical protein FWH20_00090 [Oscillospiraceae bacterium]|nr:hypothetical protein [Oscillospiraceae bacterium]